MTRAIPAAVAALLGAAAPHAYASAVIQAVSVRSSVVAGKPATLVLSMKRETPLDLAPCDLVIDTGDGEQPLRVTFGPSDSQTKRVSYTFKRAGTFKVSAKGTGRSACDGERVAEVLVTSGPSAAPRAACPAGWTAATRQGSRFTCRADPPAAPIRCDPGTKYFAEKGTIGCR